MFGDRAWNLAELGSTYREMFAGRLLLELTTYAVILVCGHLWRAENRLRAREQRLAEVERELASAQLHALRSQPQPHFLFNTLNAVSVLMSPGTAQTSHSIREDLQGDGTGWSFDQRSGEGVTFKVAGQKRNLTSRTEPQGPETRINFGILFASGKSERVGCPAPPQEVLLRKRR